MRQYTTKLFTVHRQLFTQINTLLIRLFSQLNASQRVTNRAKNVNTVSVSSEVRADLVVFTVGTVRVSHLSTR